MKARFKILGIKNLSMVGVALIFVTIRKRDFFQEND